MPSRLHAVLVAVALAVTACGGLPSDVAATVDGDRIPLDMVERMVAVASDTPETNRLAGEERVAAVADLQQRILTDLIRRSVIDREVAARGIEVTEQEIDQAREQQIAQAGGEEAARAFNPGLTEQEARDRLATEVGERKLFDQLSAEIEVSDDEVEAAYDQQRDRFEVAEASHILVETEAEAREILGLLDGGADFAELARERSQDPGSASEGGALGPAPRGSFVAPFDEAVWSADEGETVGPVQTRFGFHVIRVDAFRRTPLEEAAPQLRQQLQQQQVTERFQAFEQELFAAADVDLAERFGRYDPENASVVPSDEFAPASPASSPQPSPQPPVPGSSP